MDSQPYTNHTVQFSNDLCLCGNTEYLLQLLTVTLTPGYPHLGAAGDLEAGRRPGDGAEAGVSARGAAAGPHQVPLHRQGRDGAGRREQGQHGAAAQHRQVSDHRVPQHLQHPPGVQHGLCHPADPAQQHPAEAAPGDGVSILLKQGPQRRLQQQPPHLDHRVYCGKLSLPGDSLRPILPMESLPLRQRFWKSGS